MSTQNSANPLSWISVKVQEYYGLPEMEAFFEAEYPEDNHPYLAGEEINAIKHALASALLTMRFSEGQARMVGDLREVNTTGAFYYAGDTDYRINTWMDLYNNQVGREIGRYALENGLSEAEAQRLVENALFTGQLAAWTDHTEIPIPTELAPRTPSAGRLARFEGWTGWPEHYTDVPGIWTAIDPDTTPPWTARNVQQALVNAGANLDVDGKWGPLSRAALISFQEATGLPVTGRVDRATIEALTAAGLWPAASAEEGSTEAADRLPPPGYVRPITPNVSNLSPQAGPGPGVGFVPAAPGFVTSPTMQRARTAGGSPLSAYAAAATTPPLPQPNPLRPNPLQPSAGFTPGTPGFAQSPAMQYAMLSGVGSPPVHDAGMVPRPGPSFGSAAMTPAAPAWTALASGMPGVGQAAGPGWAELAARAGAAAAGQNTAAGFGSPGYGQAAGAGWPSLAGGQSTAGLGTPGFGQALGAAPGWAELAAAAAGGAAAGAAGAKPYGLLDAEAMAADEQNAAKKAALTAIRARTAGGATAGSTGSGKGIAAAPAVDPNAPQDSDPVDVWMAKRRAEIAQRMLPPDPDSMELSDDLPIEEWMRRRNAQVAAAT